MRRDYFEPENITALAEVLAEAKRRLDVENQTDSTSLEVVALRILRLAADGMPPWLILKEIELRDDHLARRCACTGKASAA